MAKATSKERVALFTPAFLEDLHWPRRITQEHRLVYSVGAERLDFLQARCHY